jgi:type I restriction enzyme M protein
VETVISLAPNLFFGTTIAVNILVLSKHKTDTNVQFIDASALFKKETNNNVLTDAHIEQIMQVFDSKADTDHLAKSVPLKQLLPMTITCLSAATWKPKIPAKLLIFPN